MKEIDADNIEEPLEQDIQLLFSQDKVEPSSLDQQRQKAMLRVRAKTAQRDTMLFAFVKIWSTIAEILAPIFAAFASKKATHFQSSASKLERTDPKKAKLEDNQNK